MITADLLRAIMPGAGEKADAFADALETARSRWVGDDPDDVAQWLAQVAHESGQLLYTRELADGSAYEGRAGLGNTQPGDGKRFRGRGLIQVTGRDNYTRYGAEAGVDVLASPDLLERLPAAADSAGWYWASNRIGARTAGSSDRVLAVTKIVNGGTNGLDDRRRFYARAVKAVQGAVGAPPAAGHRSEVAPAQPTPLDSSPGAPRGESPDYGRTNSMEPISLLLGILPTVAKAIPEIAKYFGPGTEVSQRNVGVATKVLETITAATGSVNALEAAAKIEANPEAAKVAREAVRAVWYEITEAGGGGIEGARKADAAAAAAGWVPWQSASFLIAIPLLVILAASVASILFPALGGAWPPETRTAVVTLIVGSILGALTGYYFGSMTGKAKPA